MSAAAGPAPRPTVLVTGFEAFAGLRSNPTEAVVADAGALALDGVDVVTRLLPVSFAGALDAIRAALDELRPDAVLCLGLAAGRPVLTPERVGVNVAHVPPAAGDGGHDRADNDGAAPRHRSVVEDGPDALLATLRPDGLVAALHAAGVPAAVSESAGTYVCNTVLLGALAHLRATGRAHVPAGFVHVPATPDLAVADPSLPSMGLDLIRTGVRACLRHAAACAASAAAAGATETAAATAAMH